MSGMRAREVPARRDDPAAVGGPVAYRSDLCQLLVVGLPQYSLLEHIQPFVQLQGKRGELCLERTDHWVQRSDRVASKSSSPNQ